MKTYSIIILSILFCTLSCSNKSNHNDFKVKSFIPDSLYSFFPGTKQIKGMNQYYRSTNAEIKSKDTIWFFSVTYDFAMYKANNTRIMDSLIYEYRKNSIAEFYVDQDSTYFIISENDEMKKLYKLNTLRRIYRSYTDKYIIPSFHRFILNRYGYNYEFNTISGLPDDYEVLIMKTGKDFVLPKNLYYDWYVLPPELKHGYSSGIAYSRFNLDMIYWVIAW